MNNTEEIRVRASTWTINGTQVDLDKVQKQKVMKAIRDTLQEELLLSSTIPRERTFFEHFYHLPIEFPGIETITTAFTVIRKTTKNVIVDFYKITRVPHAAPITRRTPKYLDAQRADLLD